MQINALPSGCQRSVYVRGQNIRDATRRALFTLNFAVPVLHLEEPPLTRRIAVRHVHDVFQLIPQSKRVFLRHAPRFVKVIGVRFQLFSVANSVVYTVTHTRQRLVPQTSRLPVQAEHQHDARPGQARRAVETRKRPLLVAEPALG